jgi:hypothetical protein
MRSLRFWTPGLTKDASASYCTLSGGLDMKAQMKKLHSELRHADKVILNFHEAYPDKSVLCLYLNPLIKKKFQERIITLKMIILIISYGF